MKKSRRKPRHEFEPNKNIHFEFEQALSDGRSENLELIMGRFSFKDWMKKDSDGRTPMHLLMVYGKQEDVENAFHVLQERFLVHEKKAILNAKNKNGDTPLFAAVKLTNSEEKIMGLVKATDLVWSELDFNAKNSGGKTLLHFVSLPDYSYDLFSEVLSRSKNSVNTQDDEGQTPLHIATKYPVSAKAKALLENGASTNTQDQYGKTPLMNASKAPLIYEKEAERIIRMLIDHSKKKNLEAMRARARGAKNPIPLSIKMGERGR